MGPKDDKKYFFQGIKEYHEGLRKGNQIKRGEEKLGWGMEKTEYVILIILQREFLSETKWHGKFPSRISNINNYNTIISIISIYQGVCGCHW